MCKSIEFSTKSYWHLNLLQGTRCNDFGDFTVVQMCATVSRSAGQLSRLLTSYSVPVSGLLSCSSSPCRSSLSSHSCHIVPRALFFLATLPRLPYCFPETKICRGLV